MKNFNNTTKYKEVTDFLVTFILVLVADIFIFITFFSPALGDKIGWLFTPSFSSLFTLFWILLAFPSLIGYYVASILRKNNPKEKSPVKIIIITIIILGSTLNFFINVSGIGRTLPYTFHPVNEAEFTNSTPPSDANLAPNILLTQNIDGTIYYLASNNYNEAVYLYKGQENKEKVWEQILPVDSQKIRDFWYDESNDRLFIIEGIGPVSSGDPYQEISLLTINNEKINKEVLSLFQPGYAGTVILNYYKENGNLLLKTSGSTGCRDEGKIWLLKGLSSYTISEFATVCTTSQEKPSYIGFNDQILFFAEYDYNLNLGPYVYPIQNIYTLNPITLVKETFIDKLDLPENTISAYISDDDKNSIILTSLTQKKYNLNINKKTVQEIPSSN